MVNNPTKLERDSEEYNSLNKACEILKELSKKQNKDYNFIIKDMYFDYGQNWIYTGIITMSKDSSWQTLNPRQWKEIVNTDNNNSITEICLEVLSTYK